MRIIIVSAPDRKKVELAQRVKGNAPHMSVFSTRQDPDGPALGSMADYRMELTLAVERMNNILNEDFSIHTGSLLDTIAHSSVNYTNEVDTTNEDAAKLFLTAHLASAMLRDSLKHDYVFFVRGSNDEYGEQIEIALELGMIAFGISYVELEMDQMDDNVKLISDIINGEQVGTSGDNQESNGDN